MSNITPSTPRIEMPQWSFLVKGEFASLPFCPTVKVRESEGDEALDILRETYPTLLEQLQKDIDLISEKSDFNIKDFPQLISNTQPEHPYLNEKDKHGYYIVLDNTAGHLNLLEYRFKPEHVKLAYLIYKPYADELSRDSDVNFQTGETKVSTK